MQSGPTSLTKDSAARQIPAGPDNPYDNLLQLVSRICNAPNPVVFCDGDQPSPEMAHFQLAIPILKDRRLLGHLCLDPRTALTETQAELARGIAGSIADLMTVRNELDHLKITSATTSGQLDRQKAFYENILNKLPTDIAVFDADHRYLFVNPGAISKEEYRKFIIGKDDYEYAAYRNRDISVAHSRRAKFLEAKNTGKEIRWEDNLPDAKGNMITHLRRMFPVYDENGALSLVIGFGIDITDRKHMEVKQAGLVRQLSVQNKQLMDFCSIVSHNLRAPLVNISMLIDFIDETGDAAEQKLLAGKLRPVIENLQFTFNELVESIQIRQNLEIESEDMCLHECVKRTLGGLQAEINKLDAQITTDFTEVSVLNFPPQYLNSIFHNLISNSLKYHYPGRKPLIHIKAGRMNGNIVLSVKDNGLGIDLVKHKDSFFKIGKVFHRHPNAKGFGLFMTKTQVEAMGGSIWVDSTPNVGSTFFVEFVKRKKLAS